MKSAPNAKSGEPNAHRRLRLVGAGAQANLEQSLGTLPTWVGSDNENDLVIDDPTVSRKHAVLRSEHGRYTIADLDSSNGTYVNGRRIKKPAPIEPGDEVSFGGARFTMVDATGVAPMRSRRRLPATVAGLISLGLFAGIGFLATRYAVEHGGLERAVARSPSNTASVMAHVSTPVPRETAEAAAQSSEAEPTADLAEVEAPVPVWLKQLNDFRAADNLEPVVNDERLSDGDRKHATYVLKNFATEIHSGVMGPEIHTEDLSNSWYTPEGAEAAHASDIAEQSAARGGKLPNPLDWAIEGWMIAPFHRLPMLSPLLRQVGFGFACEDGMCVASLNVLGGADAPPHFAAPLDHPIMFPPEGGTVTSRMRALDTEWPNPLSGCEGYSFPAGLPISVQLGPMVEAQLNSFSIAREDGAEVEACGFDANSYYNTDERERSAAINNLRRHGAVIIVPRRPLLAGVRYQVLAMVNGRDYKWTFAVTR